MLAMHMRGRIRGEEVVRVTGEAFMVMMGMILFIGGLQLEGWYQLISLVGLYVVAAVYYEELIKPLILGYRP